MAARLARRLDLDAGQHEAPLRHRPDRFNTARFDRVRTRALRLEVDLQPEFSGGVLQVNIG